MTISLLIFILLSLLFATVGYFAYRDPKNTLWRRVAMLVVIPVIGGCLVVFSGPSVTMRNIGLLFFMFTLGNSLAILENQLSLTDKGKK